MSSFSERLKEARISAGFSQEKLADTIGVSRTNVVNWESGRFKFPAADVLVRLAEALGVTERWLVVGEDPPALSAVPSRQEIARLAMLADAEPEERKLVHEWLSSVDFPHQGGDVRSMIQELILEFERFKRVRALSPNATTAQITAAISGGPSRSSDDSSF